ncbi:hypothetical protein BKA59DRAFT_453748 [Fusarium tricinctum]|uniref:Integral membrane protein n=1 Tax=Fusarium tricinctum TaxID=61284 RepID=A0A8K0S3P3_9HYPO|nr:hypothetical protein BKA59DRAFT_453748 [Fusarium tricinctum]
MRSLFLKASTCIAFLLCLSWYGQAHFYRDPGSVFFDKTRAYETHYSKNRKVEAQQVIESYMKENSATDRNKSLCIALSSVTRQTQYLPMTVGSLLHGLTKQERDDLHISVLIAEPDPTRHPNWNETWLRQAVDDVFTYDLDDKTMAHLRQLQKTQSYLEKGVFDYTYALQRCYDTGALYIGMFEDDIILADGWFIRTLRGLAGIPGSTQDWLFMRLFNQERSTGWGSREIGGNHEHWIILGVGMGISALVLLAHKRWRASRRYLDLETLFVVVFILVPGLVILLYQSGKASLFPPSPGVFNEPFGCCSQAMIFPRVQVPPLITYLQGKKKGQVDLMLNDVATENGLGRYALYPVQAQHIGIESARKTTKDEAQAIWSMAFEDLDAKALKKEHQKMVSQYQLWRNEIVARGED